MSIVPEIDVNGENVSSGKGGDEMNDHDSDRDGDHDSDHDSDRDSGSSGGEDADYEAFEDEEEGDRVGVILKGHGEAVLAVAVSSKGDFVVTGGQDDKAIMWSVDVAKVRTVYEGHKDSVLCVGISCKENYIATGDMSGLILVWRRDSSLEVKDSKISEYEGKIFEYEVDDLQWMSWHPLSDPVLVAGDQSGIIWIFKVTDGSVKSLQGFGFASNYGKVTKCGTRLVSGYEDGSLRIWDLKQSTVIHTITGGRGHSSTITSIDIDSSDSLAASGSTDCTMKLINLVSGKVIVTLPCGSEPVQTDAESKNGRREEGKVEKESKSGRREELEKGGTEGGEEDGEGIEDDDIEDSVETVAFCSSLPLIATGTLKGVIEIWDVPSQSRRETFSLGERLTKICWNPLEPFILFASGLEGSMGSWDGRSGNLLSKKVIHEDQILDFNFSSDGNILVSACEDGTCCIMNGSDIKSCLP